MSPRRDGFTLLEVLIAVAVMGLLLVLLNQGVAFGLRAAAMQVRDESRQGDLPAVDRSLRAMIAAADPGIFPEPATLQGTASSLALVTDIPSPDGEGTQRVEAALLVAGDQLLLRWQPRRHVVPLGPLPPPRAMALLGGVRALTLEYFGPQGWQPAWTAPELPSLVRLKLAFRDERRRWPPIVAAPAREPVAQ